MAINNELLRQARQSVAQLQKLAFVAAGDPSMGAPPPGGDPAAGGAPMDPSMAGGAPPPGGDPAAAGGGGDPMAAIMPMIQQAVQQAVAANGGGGAQGAGPGLKPKIDVNVEIMQIKKMLAKIVDAMGIHIPAQDMVATPEDLNQIAQGGAGYAAATPDNAGQGGGGIGQISPIEPMKAAAEEWESGVAFTPPSEFALNRAHETTRNNANLAAALVMRKRVGA
jgi:hypothetical protein